MTEHEAKMLLLRRLDDCLLEHAATVLEGGHPTIGDVYGLQSLSETHHYLKAEHTFTPAEVEALLSFRDPLDVARRCREDNPHEYSFPICELLEGIHADDRFEKYPLTLSLEENGAMLAKRLGENYFSYMEEIEKLPVQAVIARCCEIAATMTAYRYMTEECRLSHETADKLLLLDNPLEMLRSYWPDGIIEGETTLQMLLEDMRAGSSERDALPASLLERLQDAAQKIREHPSAETSGHSSRIR